VYNAVCTFRVMNFSKEAKHVGGTEKELRFVQNASGFSS
jgi:hypothetical protein